jgi:hypothetical protein
MRYRIEELSVLARFIYNTLIRDLEDFTDYSPDFDAAFAAAFLAQLILVEGLTLTKFHLAEIRNLTAQLYLEAHKTRELMFKLEGYVKRAVGMTVLPEDFGIKDVRKKESSKDMEGLVDALNLVIDAATVPANLAALTAKGYSAAKLAGLVALKDKIKLLNEQQNMRIDEKEIAVQANRAELMAMDEMMKDVLDGGKRVYKYSDKAKLGDYTLVKLMSKIRREWSKAEVDAEKLAKTCSVYGTMTDTDGNPIEGGFAKMLETNETMETDESGEYLGDGKKAGTYTMVFYCETYLTKTIANVVFVEGEDLQLDVVLEADLSAPDVPPVA